MNGMGCPCQSEPRKRFRSGVEASLHEIKRMPMMDEGLARSFVASNPLLSGLFGCWIGCLPPFSTLCLAHRADFFKGFAGLNRLIR